MDYSKIMKAVVLRSKTSEIPEWNKWVHRNLSEHHCEECLTLDGCWFEREKTPTWPHHPNCHCVLEDIPYHDVQNKGNAECLYTKFDPYLFDPKQIYKHGKEKMLESWGYSVLDVSYLQ